MFTGLRDPKNICNLPNLLTFLRIVLIPLMAICLAYDGDQPPFERDWMFRFSPGRVAAFIVLVAGISDLLDGYFARRWRVETLLGKFLDPVADKLFLMVGLVMLMKLERVSEWLVILLLSREFLITALRGVAIGEGIVIAAGSSGKFKLIFQMVGLGFLMWYGSAFGLEAWKVGTIILYLALIVSLLSGFQYLHGFFTELSKKRTG